MKRQWLHDAAKVGTGLVIADIFTHWWLLTQNILPTQFLGLPIDASMLAAGTVLDVFLLIMLVHYGWHIGKIPQIKERTYLTAAGVLFIVVAGGHIVRVLFQGEVVIFGWYVPLVLSWLGIVAATYLAYASFHFAARRR